MRTSVLLRSADRGATRLAVTALAALVVKALILNQLPAPVAQVYDLGVIADAVLASIVASYIFYLLVVHLKESNDRATLAPYLDRHTNRVVGDCESQLSELAKASGTALSLDTLTSADVTKALSAIAPYSNAPLILAPANTYANWFQYFDHHRTRSKDSIARVFAQIVYLEARRVSLLAAIDDSSHFAFISQMLHSKVSNPNLSAFAGTFFKYCEQCAALKRYMSERQSRSAA